MKKFYIAFCLFSLLTLSGCSSSNDDNFREDNTNQNQENNEDLQGNDSNLGDNIVDEDTNDKLENEENNNDETNNDSSEVSKMKANIRINGINFEVTIEDSETGKAFYNLLPLSITMNELNGNEKYYYLDESLPTNTYSQQTIETGDIMLYGSSCLVIFYETFSTSYSYTKIGKINNPENLKATVETGNVMVNFNK